MFKNKEAAQILDHKGKPYQLSLVYDTLNDTKSRKIYGNYNRIPLPENVSINQRERLQVIAFLRRSFRDNPLTSAIVYRFASAVGAPIYKSLSKTIKGKRGETLLYTGTKNIVYGKKDFGWNTLCHILFSELCVAGEIFLVKVEGKLQLIPSELVGSDEGKPVVGEVDGIKYNKDGDLEYIRVGKYINKGNWSELSFKDGDATKIPGEYVYHLRATSRIDETHGIPLLFPAIKSIVDLYDVIDAKNVSIKNNSIFSAAIKKNIDPAVYTKMLESTNETQYLNDMMLSQSRYSSFQNGSLLALEVGESIETINPSYNSQDFNDYVKGRVQEICSVLQMPANYIIGWNDASFSSCRMSALQFEDFLGRYRDRSEPFFEWVKNFVLEINDFDNSEEYALLWKRLPTADRNKEIAADIMLLNAGLASKEQITKDSAYWAEDLEQQIVDETADKILKIKEKAEEIGVTLEQFIALMPNSAQLAQVVAQMNNTNNTQSTN